MPINLSPILAQFLQASNARDLDRFVACFSADAVVEDEARTHSGIDAVRAWKRETEERYTYSIDPVSIVERDGKTILTATLAGNFPGSPIDLDYEFTIVGGAITSLSIHP